MLKRKDRFAKGMKCGDRLRAIGRFEYSFQLDQRVVAPFSGDEPPERVNRRGILREESLALLGICASAQVHTSVWSYEGKSSQGSDLDDWAQSDGTLRTVRIKAPKIWIRLAFKKPIPLIF